MTSPLVFSLPLIQRPEMMTLRKSGHDDPLGDLGSVDAGRGGEDDVRVGVDRTIRYVLLTVLGIT